MAFDGLSLKNVIIELNKNLINSRIEKIYVPTKNDIFFSFHTQNRNNLKLLISIDANNARIHFTNTSKENPIKAPQICMILRKHLQGAKLLSIEQYGLDRIVTFTFQTLNELGDLVERKLVVEIMGKYSNVILVDENNKIIDSMRHVDITMSSVREVLPNKNYILPTTLGKINFDEISFEDFKNKIDEYTPCTLSIPPQKQQLYTNDLITLLSNVFIGFSKSFVSMFISEIDMINIPLNDDSLAIIYNKLKDIFSSLNTNLAYDFKISENCKDYSLDINSDCNENLTLSYFLDDFYAKKESVSLIKMAKLNLSHDVNAHISKLNKKLKNVNKTLLESKNAEKYKQFGELLTCNMHLLKLGMDKISVQNYYNNNEFVEIPLQINISPSRNAQNYFKKYTKLRNSISHATAYKNEYEADLQYLNSVIYELDSAETLNEIDEIREELINQGYIKKVNKFRNKKQDLPSEPFKYEMNDIEILVGRNNIQNDRLTFKIAKKSFMWLHTKGFHGSHVIIKSDDVPDDVLLYAASLAAKHSEAKNSSKVEVDYTLVKYVHKESGAKPGMVVYTDYHTVVV